MAVHDSVYKNLSDDDDEDDRPIIFKRTRRARPKLLLVLLAVKTSSMNAKIVRNPSAVAPSVSQKPKAKPRKSLMIQKIEKPLMSSFQSKPTRVKVDSDEEKPLASSFQQNGSNKRPLVMLFNPVNHQIRNRTFGQTVCKSLNTMTMIIFPIAQRTKNLVSKEKQSSTKKVITKVSKSFKVPPGSGEVQKWTTLEHNVCYIPPPYKPHGVKMLYNGKPVDLSPEQEEVATMFAVMKDTEYATKKTFVDNFMKDWRTILGPNHVISRKKALKEEKMKQEEKYMWAVVDGVKEKVSPDQGLDIIMLTVLYFISWNFRVEPPGLFRGRGEHPKMGKLKRRIRPSDITINIGKSAPIPECPIAGGRWKEIRHDNTVTWLAFWNDPINSKEMKYVFLAASSSLKGQSDKEKYEKARKLKDYIHSIRRNYTRDFTSKDDTKRQIAVATYLIDKLALRAGNEKEGEEAETVGCCTLKVENFDFLVRIPSDTFNTVEVEPAVYKAELMPGLTAKVFRTYNASITLMTCLLVKFPVQQLNQETKAGIVQEKLAVYQHANKEVAIICNHQRSVSKSHDAQMSRLNDKLEELNGEEGEAPFERLRGKTKRNLSSEALEKKLMQLDAKIEKIELDKKLKEDLKTVALGTSKINYLDPRISVAWCKRHEVPIEKIFNKSLLAKFAWAMDVDPSFRF
ncbi:unnamed protein product [Spirodela intermedia]|uniref:DNA topoisomerase n=1 Tax=Spirodela intermedia TaxID=51605 RepID=A0A7I8JQF1_SPIIN|nr:unnamed protein product [Spirodela intermedia]CAA6672360.1 unnamed protein product [Spirodela intermedia]